MKILHISIVVVLLLTLTIIITSCVKETPVFTSLTPPVIQNCKLGETFTATNWCLRDCDMELFTIRYTECILDQRDAYQAHYLRSRSKLESIEEATR